VLDTFSWVEPTAWALLAIGRWNGRHPTSKASARIEEGEHLLLDRVCLSGGWNYGNAAVLGHDLPAYVSTTSLVLLALARRAGEPAVRRSRQFLYDHRLEERSGFALGLTRIALSRASLPVDDVDAAIEAAWTGTGFLGNLMGTAIALYALAGASTGYEALAD
jgi:hypothetical protein